MWVPALQLQKQKNKNNIIMKPEAEMLDLTARVTLPIGSSLAHSFLNVFFPALGGNYRILLGCAVLLKLVATILFCGPHTGGPLPPGGGRFMATMRYATLHYTYCYTALEAHYTTIRRPACVSDWKVLFLFCSWFVLVPLFSCDAFLLRLNQGPPTSLP